jgi:hypothetical protein
MTKTKGIATAIAIDQRRREANRRGRSQRDSSDRHDEHQVAREPDPCDLRRRIMHREQFDRRIHERECRNTGAHQQDRTDRIGRFWKTASA